jgi:hypothetical protein
VPALSPDDGGLVPLSVRVGILSAEFASLQSSRSMAWNESFSRAGMYLTTLSGATVALSFAMPTTGIGHDFLAFALLLLPVVLFLGIATMIRLGASNYHDAQCVIGMNRIRGAWMELAPELRPVLVMSPHDDVQGIGISMAVPPGGSALIHLLSATPPIIGVIDSVVAGAIAVCVVAFWDAPVTVNLLVGVIAFLVSIGLHVRYAQTQVMRGQASVRARYPTPPA